MAANPAPASSLLSRLPKRAPQTVNNQSPAQGAAPAQAIPFPAQNPASAAEAKRNEQPAPAPSAAAASTAPASVATVAPKTVRPITIRIMGNWHEELGSLKEREKEILGMLQSPETKTAIAGVADAASAHRYIDAAVAYVSDRSEMETWAKLVCCKPDSILESVKDLAAVGLTLNAAKGTAFLTPRKSGEDLVATSVPGVRGLEERICSSPAIAAIEANVIRRDDHFEGDEGNAKTLVFRRKLGIVNYEENPVIGAYSCIRARDGRVHLVIVPLEQKSREVELPGSSKKKKVIYFLRPDGSEVNTSRMPIDVAAAYVAQRRAMREVGRTWLHQDSAIQALITLEDRATRATIADAPKEEEAVNGPVVKDAAILKHTAEVTAGEEQETTVRTGTSVGL